MRMCVENPQSESARGRWGGDGTVQDAAVTDRENDGNFFILNVLPNYEGVYAEESEHINVYMAMEREVSQVFPRSLMMTTEPNLLI